MLYTVSAVVQQGSQLLSYRLWFQWSSRNKKRNACEWNHSVYFYSLQLS